MLNPTPRRRHCRHCIRHFAAPPPPPHQIRSTGAEPGTLLSVGQESPVLWLNIEDYLFYNRSVGVVLAVGTPVPHVYRTRIQMYQGRCTLYCGFDARRGC